MRKTTIIICILFSLKVNAKIQIGLKEIATLVTEKLDLNDYITNKKVSEEERLKSETFMDNPEVSYGKGRLIYNGGAGTSTYDEFTVSQNFNINGRKSFLQKEAKISGNLSEIEAYQKKISVIKEAQISALQYFITSEMIAHSSERKKSIKIISKYIQSRNFTSPQKKIEIELVKNRIEELEIELLKLSNILDSVKHNLEMYIGDFRNKTIKIDFLNKEKIENLKKDIKHEKTLSSKTYSEFKNKLDIQIKIYKSAWIPDLKLYYSQTNENFSGGNDNKVFGLGVSVPIFNRGLLKRKSLSLQKSVAKAEYEMSEFKNKIRKEKLFTEINVALNFLEIYNEKKVLEKEKILTFYKKKFKQGLISSSQFLDLEKQTHEIHHERLQSHFNIHSSLLMIMEMYGEEKIVEGIF